MNNNTLIYPEINYSVKGIQGIFNNVWKHFLVRGGKPGVKRFSTNNGSVGYRCDYGADSQDCRCAIGIFDTRRNLRYNELVDRLIRFPEYQPIVASMFESFEVDIRPGSKITSFLASLQSAHDTAAVDRLKLGRRIPKTMDEFRTELKDNLVELARLYKLKIPGENQ